MSIEENKALARRWLEEIGNENLDVFDEVFAPDCVWHRFDFPSVEAAKEYTKNFHAVFTDPVYTVEDTVAEKDKVAVRWTVRVTHSGEWAGAAPTGKQIEGSGITILRFDGGKVVELRDEQDNLGFLQQLGVIPPLGEDEG
jgi:predicted ester cyclase